MSYIGRGVDAISNVEKLDNITFDGGTTYALTKSSAAYKAIPDQLDQIYHDIEANKLDETGEWFKAVKKVKDDNSKA